MARTSLLSLALALVIMIAGALQSTQAQQRRTMQHQHRDSTGMQMRDTSMGGMMQMMQQCREQCQKTGREAEAALKEIEAVRNSGDPAKLKAALTKAETPLRDMRTHMQMCRRMMDRMGKQSGGMMQQGNNNRRYQDTTIELREPKMPPDTASSGE